MRFFIRLLLLIIIFTAFGVFGKEISQQTANNIAADMTSQLSVFDYQTLPVSKTYTISKGDTNLFHVCNVGEKDGFIIVTAQDVARPVLGYSSNGSYDPQNLPPNFKAWLDEYKNHILTRVRKQARDRRTRKMWDEVLNQDMSAMAGNPIVSPLLGAIEWDQGPNWFNDAGPHWNSMCPEDTNSSTDNGRVWAGCVATATGMVMKYHSYPGQGVGSHSYNHPDYGTQSADFGATTYNWTNMPPENNNVTMDIAELLYHLGVSVDMNYGPNGSGASTRQTVTSLIDYFQYSPKTKYVYRKYYSDTEWKDMLKEQLDAGLPMIYRGSNSDGTSGHAFVCDGYDDAEYFHFNWGWSGSYNGYFTINDLTPGSYDYSYEHAAGFDIQEPGYNDYAIVNMDDNFYYSDNYHQLGQSFITTRAGVLEEIRLRLVDNLSTTLRIYNGTDIQSSNEIYNQSIDFEVPLKSFAEITFDVNNPIELNANSPYTVVIDQARVNFDDDTYADGTLYYDGSFYTGYDLQFNIFINGIIPAPTSLNTQNVTRNSADLNWDENGSATTWNVEYGPAGFTQGTGTTIQTLSKPHSLEDLPDNESYDFYVQAVCDDKTSDWSRAGSFSVLTTPPGHNLVFDGADDYIQMGNVGSVQTIEFWVKPSTITEGLANLTSTKSINVTDGQVDLAGESGETVYINGQTGGTLETGLWSHVAIVVSSSINVNQFQIGFDGSDYLTGSIDDFRLWSASLSQNDIQTRLHATLSGTETDLKAYYPCDESSGTELTDNSQNSYHGTLKNMAGDEWTKSLLPAGDNADWISSGSTLLNNMTVSYEAGSSGSLGLFATGTGDDWLQTDDGTLLNKYWGIEEYGSVTATLNFDLSGTSLPSGKSWSDIHLLKRDDKTSNWQDVTGLCSHTPTSAEPYFEITQSEFSEFRPASETPIAVKLAYFKAVKENDAVRLSWLTETETNLAGFNISRRFDKNDQFVQINDKIISAQDRHGQNYVYTDKPPHDGVWTYRLEEIDLSGRVICHAPVKVDFTADVAGEQTLPQEFCLYPNYPNPFNPETKFSFDVPHQTHVKIAVYDVLGRQVHTLVDAVRPAGHYNLRWDATDGHSNTVASGVYFLVMTANNYRFKHKMMLLH